MPAIAYAVTLNVTGAAVAYARLTSHPDWNTFYSNLGHQPQFAIVPKKV